MKFFKYITQHFRKDDKKILGRWTIDYCDVKVSKKIDLSNEDHCGPCGQYIKDKIRETTHSGTNQSYLRDLKEKQIK